MTLDKLPSIIAAITFFAVATAVAHEWAYFGVIGQDFQSLYTTHDYIALIIIGIGPSFIFIIIAGGIQMLIYRSDEFQIKSVPWKNKFVRWIDSWLAEIIWTLGLILSLLLEDETRRFALYSLLAILSVRVVSYVFSYSGLKKLHLTPVYFIALILPGAMILSYGLGRDAAYSDLKTPTMDLYALQLKDQTMAQYVKVLRIIDKGIIRLDPATRSIGFLRTEEIALLQRQAPTWNTQSIVCRYFGWRCATDASETTNFSYFS